MLINCKSILGKYQLMLSEFLCQERRTIYFVYLRPLQETSLVLYLMHFVDSCLPMGLDLLKVFDQDSPFMKLE